MEIKDAYGEDIFSLPPCALIDNAQTVERPQGEWLWLCDAPNAKYKWSCNKCGRGVKEQENYCPNCGAKMKGGAV